MKDWSSGRLKSFITSTIRSGFRRYPTKYEALKEARRGKKLNPKSGREAMHYECASCHNEFTQTNIQVDHISPVVDPLIGFVSWDEFITRLFCSRENLQVLCSDCHLKKTKAERLSAKLHKMQKGIIPVRNSQKSKKGTLGLNEDNALLKIIQGKQK